MNIAILGAGIIGVTTAYELAADGHQVTVFERHASVAEGASFATAGLLGAGGIVPWASPHGPLRTLARLLAGQAPVQVARPLAAADLAWLRRWLRGRDAAAHAVHRARLQRLAAYSRQRLHEVAGRMAYDFDRGSGVLVLLRGERERQLAQPGVAALRELGVACREIEADEARRIEPALNPHTPLAGALHLPQDEVGNCRQFAVILRDAAEGLGARFMFGTAVAALDPARPATLRLAGDPAPRHFDAVVLCAGAPSAALLAPLGLRLPLRPVYGYSISAHIPEPLHAPVSGVVDERLRVTLTRLGQRVRVAGAAEIGGRADALNARALQTLYQALADWFPAAGRLSSGVQVWKGARPALPDGLPLVGASGLAGLWLNLGHGDGGWALACGSARVVADLIAGRAAEIDTDGLGPARLR
jgi:D-amino-acid dehydrogenase